MMMYEHALGFLDDAVSWEWPMMKLTQASGDTETKCGVVTASASLLRCLIVESHNLGGSVLDRFRLQLGNRHPRLEQNSEKE
jgi:hypothetical protein